MWKQMSTKLTVSSKPKMKLLYGVSFATIVPELALFQVFLAKKTKVEVAAAEGYVFFVKRTRHWQNIY